MEALMDNVITVAQYIKLLNQLLEKQAGYKPGMRIIFDPAAAAPDNELGLDVAGGLEPSTLAMLDHELRGQYTVTVHPRGTALTHRP